LMNCTKSKNKSNCVLPTIKMQKSTEKYIEGLKNWIFVSDTRTAINRYNFTIVIQRDIYIYSNWIKSLNYLNKWSTNPEKEW
jgi:hypothetical protein